LFWEALVRTTPVNPSPQLIATHINHWSKYKPVASHVKIYKVFNTICLVPEVNEEQKLRKYLQNESKVFSAFERKLYTVQDCIKEKIPVIFHLGENFPGFDLLIIDTDDGGNAILTLIQTKYSTNAVKQLPNAAIVKSLKHMRNFFKDYVSDVDYPKLLDFTTIQQKIEEAENKHQTQEKTVSKSMMEYMNKEHIHQKADKDLFTLGNSGKILQVNQLNYQQTMLQF